MVARSVIGETVIDNEGAGLGVVTAQYKEGQDTIIVISGDYEQPLSDFEYVIDLTRGGSFLREKGILHRRLF